MKPLLYLTLKQFKNGLIRAASSPKRLIGLLFFVGYYFMIFGRPMGGNGRGIGALPSGVPKLDFPPLQVIDAMVFAVLAAVSIFMLMGTASQQTAYKPADVDVLFATPISPKVVLVFRMVRDYFFTLIVPFIILLFGFRSAKMGWDALFRNFPNPEYGGMAIRALSLGWILIAMAWISINYATSLFINRSDRASDRNKKILGAAIAAVILAIGAYIYLAFREIHSVKEAIAFSMSPGLRAVFFMSTLATQMVMAPLTGNWMMGLVGLCGLLGITALAIRVALTQSNWMYDQAAVRGFGNAALKEMQKKGDVLGVTAEMARRGKIRARRIRWLAKARWTGPMALVWKEAFLQVRGMMAMLIWLCVMAIFISIVPILVPQRDSDMPVRYLLFLMQGVSLMSITMPLAQLGFIEVLRRVDLLKPLPFSSTVISFVEVLGRAMLGILASLVSTIAVAVAKPSLAVDAFGAFILVIGLSTLMSASVWLVTILFPDFDDHTQRQFRGFLTLIAVAVLGFFPVVVFLPLWLLLHWPSPLAALLATAIALAMSGAVCLMSGKLYEGYNPSE